MNKPALAFANQQVPVIGQPFTIHEFAIPVNLKLTCNCGGADTMVTILASQPSSCPSCRKVFVAAYNPTNQQIQVQMGIPEPEQVPN